MAELGCLRLLNPWELHLQKLGLELKCPSCLDLFNEPILLPCNHILCGSCVSKSVVFGPECTLCKRSYCLQDVRKAPYMESIVNVYRNLYSSFSNHKLQLSSPDQDTISEKTLFSADMNATNRSATNYNTGFQTCGVIPSPLTPSSQLGLKPLQQLEAMDLDQEHFKHLSPDSSPSFGNNKRDLGRDDYGTRSHPAKKSKISVDKSVVDQPLYLSTLVADNPSQKIKEQKQCSNDVLKQNKITSQTSTILNLNNAVAVAGDSQLQTTTFADTRLTSSSEDLGESNNFICGFCQTWKVTEYTGQMLHYANGTGKPVAPREAACSNTIHVHSKCIEWAPQTYYEGENVRNLNKELSRGAKLKCNKCGLKGAALGCYAKSCKKSYHAPCAVEIPGCRWDCENFLVLCPAHVSQKFPNEKHVKRAVDNSKDSTAVDEQQAETKFFWVASSMIAQNWTFCGSSLSANEKSIMVKFVSMCGANMTRSWNPDVTHVIAATDANGACTRTLKVLMAILKGRWILKTDWVKACMEEKRLVDEEAYEVNLDNHGCYDGPRKGRLRILNNEPKLFAGLKFYFMGEFVSKYKEDLLNLITAAGGVTVDKKGELVEHPVDDCKYPSTNHHLVIYNNDAASAMGVDSDLFQQRVEAAVMVATETDSKAIPHTWILDSIASCKLQPLA